MSGNLLQQAELYWANYLWAAWESGEWATQPEEERRYGQHHLVEHVDEAGFDNQALYSLLSEDWLHSWEEEDGSGQGFLDDVARIWRRADAGLQIPLSTPPDTTLELSNETGSLAMQLRCALCYSGSVSRTANVPPKLLLLAVDSGVFTPRQAVALAHHFADWQQRANALAALAPRLPEAMLEELLWSVAEIEDERQRVHAFSILLPHLSSASTETLSKMVARLNDQAALAEALADLAAYLPAALLPKVLQTAKEIRRGWERQMVLVAVAAALSANAGDKSVQDMPAMLLNEARELDNDWDKAQTLAGLGLYLPRRWLEQVVAEIEMVGLEEARVHALALVASGADRALQLQLIEIAQRLVNPARRGEALVSLVTKTQPQLLPQILIMAESCDEWDRVRLLQTLPPELPDQIVVQALQLAQSLSRPLHRAEALALLLPHLPELQRQELLPKFLHDVQMLQEEASESLAEEAVVRLQIAALRYLPRHERDQVLPKIIASVELWREGDAIVDALARLAPALNLRETEMVVRLVGRMQLEHRPRALVTLALHLRGLVESIVREAIFVWPEPEVRFEALLALMPHLSPVEHAIAVETALTTLPHLKEHNMAGIQSPRAEALANLAPYLTAELWPAAYHIGAKIEYEPSRAKALIGLVPHLPEAWLHSALEQVRALNDPQLRTRLLTDLAARLGPDEAPDAVREALAAARQTRIALPLTKAAVGLSPYLPASLQQEIVAMIEALPEASSRAHFLTRMLPILPPDRRQTAFIAAHGAAMAIDDLVEQAEALVALAPQLTIGLCAHYLEVALELSQKDRLRHSPRARVLVAAMPHLPDRQRLELAETALTAVLQIEGVDHRLKALIALAAYLPKLLLARALQAAAEIPELEQRGSALAGLAPFLPPDLLQQALAAISEIGVSVRYEPGSPQGFWVDLDETRCRALIDMLPLLPPAQRAAVAQTALAVARQLPEEDQFSSPRAVQLARLLSYLPEQQCADLLSEVAVLTSQLPVFGAQGTLLRAATLSNVADALPTDLRERLLAAVYVQLGSDWRLMEIVKGPPELLRPESPEQIAERVERARDIENLVDRMHILARLSNFVPDAEIAPAMTLMIASFDEHLRQGLALRYAGGGEERRRSQDRLEPLPHFIVLLQVLLARNPEQAYSAWKKLLHRLSAYPLPVVLDILAELVPIAMRLSPHLPSEVAPEMLATIRQVPDWWA